MGILYIAGQRPGAGATALAAALATVLRRAGRRVALTKPLSLGDQDQDADLFASVSGTRATPSLAAGAVVTGDVVNSAVSRVQALAKEADILIVEGLPMTAEDGTPLAASAELAGRLNARVVGVLPYTRAAGRAAADTWRQVYGQGLSGVVINRRTKYGRYDAEARLGPELAGAGVPPLGIVDEDRLMLAPTVQQVADHLNGTFHTGVSGADQLIEHFLIGGLITEWGGNYFGRYPNQAVIARCGRTDLQMAALNFPLNALFLTGGCLQPPQYVYQRADYMDVPLITVSHTTEQAVEALGDLHVTVHHPAKVERFSALAAERLDWDAVSAAGL